MLPRGRVYRYLPGRNMPDVPIPGVAGGMLSVPYDMGAMPVRDAIEGMNGTDLDGRNITVTEAQSRGSGGGGERQMGHRDERNESERQRLNSGYKNPGGLVCFYCCDRGWFVFVFIKAEFFEYLQAEFFARGGCSSNEVQVLKERIAWLEAANEDICRELHDYRSRYTAVEQRETDAQDASICSVKTDGLKRSLHSVESPEYQMGETISGDSRDIDEEVAKEWEHTLLQNIMEENVRLSALLDKKEAQLLAMNEKCKGAAAWEEKGKKIN